MRPLKRPMFKTGGPIKEGVMNGLRDGGVATTMADATMMAGGGMPNMRGRVTGPGGYAGEKNIFGMGVAKNPDGTPVTIPRRNFFEDASFVLNPFTKLKVASMMGKAGIRGGKEAISSGIGSLKNFFKGPVPARKAGEVKNRLVTTEKAPFLSDKFFGQYIKGPLQSTKKAFTDAFGPAAGSIKDYKTAIGLGIPTTGFGAYKMYQGYKDRQKGSEAPPPPGEGGTGNVPDAVSGTRKPTKAEIEAKTKELEDKKLNRIYKLLGVDRAKRNAASKALIDMSRYIDEGGKDVISKKNIGSTISKGISAFDKRLDKVDQLKEAAGLMQAKAEIEAMSDPNKKKLQELQIELGEDKLRPGVNSTLISSRTIKKGALTEQETIDAVRIGAANEGSALLGSITSDQIDDGNYKGKTVIDIVTDLKPEKNGYFVIGKSIVKVESGVPKLISGPLAID